MRKPAATIPVRAQARLRASFGAIPRLFRVLPCQFQPLFGSFLSRILHKAKGVDK